MPDPPQATAWLTVTLKPWGGRLAIRKGKHPVAEPSERRTIAGPYPPLISTLTAPDAPGRRGHGSRRFEQSFEPHTARVTMSAVSFFTWTLAGSLEIAHPARATLAVAASTSKATPRADEATARVTVSIVPGEHPSGAVTEPARGIVSLLLGGRVSTAGGCREGVVPGKTPRASARGLVEPPKRIELLTYSLRVNRSTD